MHTFIDRRNGKTSAKVLTAHQSCFLTYQCSTKTKMNVAYTAVSMFRQSIDIFVFIFALYHSLSFSLSVEVYILPEQDKEAVWRVYSVLMWSLPDLFPCHLCTRSWSSHGA